MLSRSGRSSPLGEVRYVIASIAVSGFGTWSYNVGIAVYAYERTHSAAWVAVVTVGRYVPAIVLSWWAAALVDRLPRRGLVVSADLACAAIMAVLAALGAANAPVWLLTVVAALSSTAARVQAAAVLSLAADLVVESQLVRASVLAAASEAVATATGAAAASALLLHFAPADLFAINAVSFVASALLITRVRAVPVRRAQVGARAEPAERLTTGRVWPLQASRTITAYVYGMDVVLLTVVASRELHAGTSGYGWLLAGAGFGGLIATLPTRRLVGGSGTATATATGTLLYALPLLVFLVHLPLAGGLATQLIRGAGAVLATSSVMGALQWAVPSASAGRVFGATQSLVLTGTCVGSIVTAALLGSAGFDTTIVIGALGPCVAQLVLYPLLLRFDRQDAQQLAALDPRLGTLRRLDLLRDASRSTLYEVADSIADVPAAPGTVIMAKGDVSDCLYVLAAGAVEVIGGSPDAAVVVAKIEAPGYFGEIGLFRRVARTATVRACEPCELWRIPGDRFLAAVAEAGVSGALMDTIQIRFDTTQGATPIPGELESA